MNSNTQGILDTVALAKAAVRDARPKAALHYLGEIKALLIQGNKALRTGMQYKFVVVHQKANGSDRTAEEVRVIALSKAGAWRAVGEQTEEFMNGPRGRAVLSISMVLPKHERSPQ